MKQFPALILIGFFGFEAVAASITYDAAGQYASNSNPAGAWSYGYVADGQSPFSLATTSLNGAWGTGCSSVSCGLFVRYDDGHNALNLGEIGGPALALCKDRHASGLPTVRFTVPNNGAYRIEIRAWSPWGAPHDLQILVNGTMVFSSLFDAASMTFTNLFDLIAGQTIDFIGSQYNDLVSSSVNYVYLQGGVRLANPAGIDYFPMPGLFTNSVTVSVLNDASNGVIRLTTDGTTPTPSSPLYDGPVVVTNTTEFRAAVFSSNAAISQVFTGVYARVYAIDDGIPASWRVRSFGPGYLTDPRVSADADPDGDLSTNWEEYLAGTNPVEPNSGVTRYDFVKEFSTTANPFDVWTYGYKLATNSPVDVYPTNYAGSWGYFTNQAIITAWSAGSIRSNVTSSVEFEIRPFSAGPYLFYESPVLRFTAPHPGSGLVQFIFNAQVNDERLYLFLNGQSLLSDLVTQGASYSNHLSFPLGSDGTLDFMVQRAGGPNPVGSSFATLVGTVTFDVSAPPSAVAFFPNGGFFTNSLRVLIINILSNGVVKFTTNATDPTSASFVYAGPIELSASTEIRAAVFSGDSPISAVYTASYARVYAIDDGIPASWREQYFGPDYLTDPRVSADADPDGDLSTNWEEYLAGTNPLDSTSGFKATATAVPMIRFGSVVGRSYRILRRDQINSEPIEVTTILATNTLTTYVDTSITASTGIYLIELLP